MIKSQKFPISFFILPFRNRRVDIVFLEIHNWKEAAIGLVYVLYEPGANCHIEQLKSSASRRASFPSKFPSAIMSCEFSNRSTRTFCDRGVDLHNCIVNFMCRCRSVLCLRIQHRARLILSTDNFSKKKPRRDAGKRVCARAWAHKFFCRNAARKIKLNYPGRTEPSARDI